ncbi:hypothetical protein ABKN59_003031 [Abortiporus biennis]
MFGLYRQIHTGPHAIPPCSTYQTKGPDRGIAYIEYVLNEHSSIGCFNLKNYSTVLSQTMRIPIRVVPSTQTRIKETVKPSLAGTLLFVSSAVALRSGISATFRQSNFAHDDQTLSGPRRNTCIPQTNDSIFMIDAPCIWRHINIVLLPHPGLASIHPLHAISLGHSFASIHSIVSDVRQSVDNCRRVGPSEFYRYLSVIRTK